MIIEIYEWTDLRLPTLLQSGTYKHLTLDQLQVQNPDCHLVVLNNQVPQACASLWWDQVPSLEGHKLGVIGHFSATDNTSAALVLNACCQRLQNQGCTLAVGPMDGSTWGKYRLVTWGLEEPAFMLEPENPPEYPRYFEDSGFTVNWQYLSTVETGTPETEPRILEAEARMVKNGVVIRPFRNHAFNEDLKKICQVSLVSFVHNLFYMEQSEERFLAQYQPFRGQIVENLALIAEQDNRAVGYVFAYPDYSRKARGYTMDTAVLKTLAILPGRAYAGLGAVLVDRIRKNAWEMGYTRVIHALMHESNVSKAVSQRRHAERIRSYGLYAKELRE